MVIQPMDFFMHEDDSNYYNGIITVDLVYSEI